MVGQISEDPPSKSAEPTYDKSLRKRKLHNLDENKSLIDRTMTQPANATSAEVGALPNVSQTVTSAKKTKDTWHSESGKKKKRKRDDDQTKHGLPQGTEIPATPGNQVVGEASVTMQVADHKDAHEQEAVHDKKKDKKKKLKKKSNEPVVDTKKPRKSSKIGEERSDKKAKKKKSSKEQDAVAETRSDHNAEVQTSNDLIPQMDTKMGVDKYATERTAASIPKRRPRRTLTKQEREERDKRRSWLLQVRNQALGERTDERDPNSDQPSPDPNHVEQAHTELEALELPNRNKDVITASRTRRESDFQVSGEVRSPAAATEGNPSLNQAGAIGTGQHAIEISSDEGMQDDGRTAREIQNCLGVKDGRAIVEDISLRGTPSAISPREETDQPTAFSVPKKIGEGQQSSHLASMPLHISEGGSQSVSGATSEAASPLRPKTTKTRSQFFKKADADDFSCLKFPTLRAPAFGVVQERLANDPFRLLVAVILLNQTRGSVAVPVCDQLFEKFTSIRDIAQATPEQIQGVIGKLGLQQRRAETIIDLARVWLQNPPQRGRRWRHLHYPETGSGKNISWAEEPLAEEDPREAWEIAHLPGVGAYALDSWRIFCRDTLRQRASGMLPLYADGSANIEIGQEWTAVLPRDKELRAYLRWRWLRLGFLWDAQTGEKVRISRDTAARLERKEIKSYFGYRNPWLLDFMVTEETPFFAIDTNILHGNSDAIELEDTQIKKE